MVSPQLTDKPSSQIFVGEPVVTRPSLGWVAATLCIAWSLFQLWIAWFPINALFARMLHLGFALALVYLIYPSRKSQTSHSSKIALIVNLVLGSLAILTLAYLWLDYDNIILRQGLPTELDVILGSILIVLLLEAARRVLGPMLSGLCAVFLIYCFVGPYLPDLLRHRGIPLDFVINDMYLSDTGIFGVPLGVSTSFVFLFVLFGSLLDKAGAGQYFVDLAYAMLGRFRGGPAKASVVASGLTGMVSGSSIANVVTTGTFTIPLMKRVGFPAHKAAAVEVASSTNGQLMPPIMGAAAFIMAEIVGIPYADVIHAALLPAIASYLALFFLVDLEAGKLGLKPVDRTQLPPRFKTFIRGVHYLIPLLVLIFYLVVLRRSAITSALLAIEATAVIIMLQPVIRLWLSGHCSPSWLMQGLMVGALDIRDGLIQGARNMIPVAVATAAAGIIVGVVTITGLVGRFVELIDVLSAGNIFIMLLLTAVVSIILGMGLPTTANYIIMATLTAPVIIQLGGDAGLVFPLIAAHLFVFYFGILADDTPPVGLAAYAAAGIAQSDPIKTGIQGFSYDLRTAILPFAFLLNPELLLIAGVGAGGEIIWLDNVPQIIWVVAMTLAALLAFTAAVQGFLVRKLHGVARLVLIGLTLLMLVPNLIAPILNLPTQWLQSIALMGLIVIIFWQLKGRGQSEH